MKNLLLTLSCLLLICLTPLASANLSNTPWIPPTNANSRIATGNGTVHEMNYSSNYNFVGTGSITITGSNNSKTVYFNGASPPVNNHQGTYNQTLANNVVKNSGGRGLNFINGTNNPITLTNDPTRNQINITISSTGSGGSGVTSLNALTGALTIACVSGNTTCTTSGGNTITVNTAFNIVTTGLSAQTITKGLTLNALTLGGNAVGGNKNFTGLNQVNATKFFQNGTQVIDTLTQGSGISITGSGHSRTISNTGVLSAITSINSQTGPAVSIIRQPSYTTITNNTNSIKVGIDATGVMELNGTQTITGSKTFSGANIFSNNGNNFTNGFLIDHSRYKTDQGGSIELGAPNSLVPNPITNGEPYIDWHFGNGKAQDYNIRTQNSANNTFTISNPTSGSIEDFGDTITSYVNQIFNNGITMSGSDINLGSNSLTNSGHKSTLPSTSGILCQTNQSSVCGSGLTTAITSINSQTGPSINLNRGSVTNMSSVTNSSNVISYQLKNDIVLTNGSAQTISKGITHTATLTMSGANIALGSNAITTTRYTISDSAPTIVPPGMLFQPTGGNTGASLSLAPHGTNTQSVHGIFRTSDTSTNYELLYFGTDPVTTGEFSFDILKGGTGVLRPFDWYMSGTKLQSYDIANTITSYVQNIWTPISDPVTAFTNAIWKSSTTTDVIKYRNNANTTTYNIVSTISATNATTGQLSGNGTGTTSASLVMDGVYATLSPANTGRITVTVSGGYKSSVTSDGCIIGIRQSTSNMGANGAAVAGSALGNNLHFLSAVGGDASGFARTYDFTGTVGTKYFFDLAFARITGGTCTLQDINWDLVEH